MKLHKITKLQNDVIVLRNMLVSIVLHAPITQINSLDGAIVCK